MATAKILMPEGKRVARRLMPEGKRSSRILVPTGVDCEDSEVPVGARSDFRDTADGGLWSHNGDISVVPNDILSPGNIKDADKIIIPTGSSSRMDYTIKPVGTPGADLAVKIWLKPAASVNSDLQLNASVDAQGSGIWNINLQALWDEANGDWVQIHEGLTSVVTIIEPMRVQSDKTDFDMRIQKAVSGDPQMEFHAWCYYVAVK